MRVIAFQWCSKYGRNYTCTHLCLCGAGVSELAPISQSYHHCWLQEEGVTTLGRGEEGGRRKRGREEEGGRKREGGRKGEEEKEGRG